MSSVPSFESLRPHVRAIFADLNRKITPGPAADRFWQRLTDEDRRQLGEDCRFRMTAAEMWLELRGVSPPRAILDVARLLNFLSDVDHESLVREIGEQTTTAETSPKPTWNRDRCELRFDGQLVRRIRSLIVARNIVAILDEFQRHDWPDRIDDPLPGPADSHRLRETLASLNASLLLIRFRMDGTGTGVIWEWC